MDFQSAARFGERRVMVTDYDETAVEVNAKVVDEDTGEVICESGGGGENGVINATVTLTADSTASLIITNPLREASDVFGESVSGYYVDLENHIEISNQTPVTILTLYSGLNFEVVSANESIAINIEVIEGDAILEEVTIGPGYDNIKVLNVSGNCTLKVTTV